MRRDKYTFYFFIVSVFLFCFLFSCAPKSEVLGRWLEVEDKARIEFRRDGTFAGVDNMGAKFKGNYISSNGNIRLTVTHSDILSDKMNAVIPPEIVNAKISVNGDVLELMIISDQEGKTEIERYRRENQ